MAKVELVGTLLKGEAINENVTVISVVGTFFFLVVARSES